jgi:hypothetical protein
VETRVELETFEPGNTSLARQVFNLTASGDTEHNLLPALEQALREGEHRLGCTGPPPVTQEMQNR